MKPYILGVLLVCGLAAAQAYADLLGDEFRSPANGIALRPPACCTKINTSDPSLVVEFDDDADNWTLKVHRLSFENPVPLEDYKDQFGQDHDGFLRTTAKQLKEERLADVVAQDIIHIGPHDRTAVGMLVQRRMEGIDKRLVQEALVQANDQLYYVIELDTPGRADPNGAGDDPGERRAADAFDAVVHSVQLLDRAAIFRDQAERLIRFRGLLANWTPSYIESRLKPQQYFRLVCDGKDIGYRYEIDEIDKKAGSIAGNPVLKVSLRSDTQMSKGVDVQTQSRFQVTIDRKHENWLSLVVQTTTPQEPNSPPVVSQLSELGVSDEQLRPVPLVPLAGGGGPIQPGVAMQDSWVLTVVHQGGDAKEFKKSYPRFQRDLPSFYVPQALSYLLPRLVEIDEPKTYLCAVYVPDGDHGKPGLVMRYLDVLSPQVVTLDGKNVVAVPVKDRIGIDGVVTTHYLNPNDGSYLGSVTTTTTDQGQTTAMVLPSDEATLRRLWPKCDLTRPDRIVDEDSKTQ